MNEHIAFEAARMRVEQVSRRATLMGSLGQVPNPRPLLPFQRRRVVALPGVVELKRG